MTLRSGKTSPYICRAMTAAMEIGLADRITLEPTDDGTRLCDGPVICEPLDGLHDGPKLFPTPGPVRWTALRLQALGAWFDEEARRSSFRDATLRASR